MPSLCFHRVQSRTQRLYQGTYVACMVDVLAKNLKCRSHVALRGVLTFLNVRLAKQTARWCPCRCKYQNGAAVNYSLCLQLQTARSRRCLLNATGTWSTGRETYITGWLFGYVKVFYQLIKYLQLNKRRGRVMEGTAGVSCLYPSGYSASGWERTGNF